MIRYSFTFWFYEKKNPQTGAFEDPIIVSVVEPTYGEALRRASDIASKNDKKKNLVFLQQCVELLEQQPKVVFKDHDHE